MCSNLQKFCPVVFCKDLFTSYENKSVKTEVNTVRNRHDQNFKWCHSSPVCRKSPGRDMGILSTTKL